jgi:ferredoxin
MKRRSFISGIGFLIIGSRMVLEAAVTLKKVSLIDQKKCVKCGTCFKNCPVKAITKTEKDKKIISCVIDPKKCINCGLCRKNCKVKAINAANYDPTNGISTIDKDSLKVSEAPASASKQITNPAPAKKQD